MARSIIPKGGNDKIMTPSYLAQSIVDYFDPFKDYGIRIIEPCKGSGVFIDAFKNNTKYWTCGDSLIKWCELDEGVDFLTHNHLYTYDWVITNPPFSQFRAFLNKSMDIANNVVFLSLVNAFFFKARLRDIREKGFGFKEIVFVDTPPPPWPQFGIQLGVVHLQKDYKGDTKFTYGLK